MRVLIIYNEPVRSPDHPDAASEREILETAVVVEQHLSQAGCQAVRLGVGRDPAVLLDGLRRHRPDVVFNLFEGLADHYETEAYLAGLLEWLGVPYTGCPPQAMTLARNKHLAKQLLKGAGLPTPDFFVVERLPVPACPLPWPVIIKPAREDASIGLDQNSVACDQRHLERRVGYLLEQYGPPVLVEQFIPGREFNVGLIEAPELRVLPLAEIEFLVKDESYWPIVTYDAKWKPGTPEYDLTPPRYPADVPAPLAERLRSAAAEAFRLLGCRVYARVDFRVSAAEEIFLLEVNPTPDFSPLAGLAGGLHAAGISHAEYTVALARNAAARGRSCPSH